MSRAAEPPFGPDMRTATVVRAARERADWDLVRGVYLQRAAIAADDDARFMPDTLVGYLAEAFGRVAANYHGEEELFVRHALAVLANGQNEEHLTPALFEELYADARFDRFKQYGIPDADGATRRRPRPFETVVETARRYRDVNCAETVLGASTSGILGGSTSYGRFFNVAGRSALREASDLDLLLVVPDYRFLGTVLENLGALDGLSQRDLDVATRRAEVFATLGLDNGYTIFSHKLSMWSEEPDPLTAWADKDCPYAVSLHVLSLDVLKWLLVADTPKLHENEAGSTRSIRDYRERPSQGQDIQRCFGGQYRRTDASTEEAEMGFVRNAGVYSIRDERYFPGMFQNLVFPRFDLRWDSLRVFGLLEAFRFKLIERLRYERKGRPYEMLRLSLAHTRTEVFAPNVLRRIDGGEQP